MQEAYLAPRRIGPYSQNPLLHNYIINFRSTWSDHFAMDFVEVASQTATAFADNKLLYLHCVDFRATETVCLNDFPCLGVKLVLGHVSFPRKLAERRMCAFLNRRNLMDDLKDRRSPVLIEVLNSCDIKVKLFKSCLRFLMEHFWYDIRCSSAIQSVVQ